MGKRKVERVVEIDRLIPYFNIAEKTAKESPCLRRKYGAVIAYAGEDIRFIASTNSRVAKCCKDACIRTRMSVMNGERTEMGAEIHAETAVLIMAGPREDDDSYLILVGFDPEGKEFFGKHVYPCHACAMAIKFAGYTHVYLRTSPGVINAISIAKILEEREEEWQPTSII